MAKKTLKKTDEALVVKLNKANGVGPHIDRITFKTSSPIQKLNAVLNKAGHGHLEVAAVKPGPSTMKCKKYVPIIKNGKVVGFKCVLWE